MWQLASYQWVICWWRTAWCESWLKAWMCGNLCDSWRRWVMCWWRTTCQESWRPWVWALNSCVLSTLAWSTAPSLVHLFSFSFFFCLLLPSFPSSSASLPPCPFPLPPPPSSCSWLVMSTDQLTPSLPSPSVPLSSSSSSLFLQLTGNEHWPVNSFTALSLRAPFLLLLLPPLTADW